jgi:hypothetical protein
VNSLNDNIIPLVQTKNKILSRKILEEIKFHTVGSVSITARLSV